MPIDRTPTKVSVVGAGAVGSSVALSLLLKGVAQHVVLQDINEPKAVAEAADMAHGSAFYPPAQIEGTSDVDATAGSDVVVVTAGAKQQPGQTRMDLAGATVGLIKKILPPLVERSPSARFVMVTNPVDVTTEAAIHITGLPREQMFGSGTVLDSARLRYQISQATGVAVRNVHAYMVGEHGDTEVPLWSAARIGGISLFDWERQTGMLGEEVRERIAHDTVYAAYRIIEGKGATNHAIGLSAADIVQAVIRDENRILPVSSHLDDWLGIKNVTMSVPTLVGRHGAAQPFELKITDSELVALRRSGETISNELRGLGF